ncbi:MAG: hypothetical protein RR215_01395, partial [Ruthenibacterium sp.]
RSEFSLPRILKRSIKFSHEIHPRVRPAEMLVRPEDSLRSVLVKRADHATTGSDSALSMLQLSTDISCLV